MVKKYLLFLVIMSVFSCNESLSSKEEKELLKKGNEITQATFKELSGHLMQQMKLGGPEQAIPFCNIQAMPITSKMAKKYDVTIKRTSDKIRNIDNKATTRELEIIKKFQYDLQEKIEIKSMVEIDNNKEKHFYAPIIVNSKCLSCHGKLKEGLSIKTDSLVKSLYENDLAVGYKDGDLRGIWSITFSKKDRLEK